MDDTSIPRRSTLLVVMLGLYAAGVHAIASLHGAVDRGHLPAAVVAVAAMFMARWRPRTAARLIALSVLELLWVMLAAWGSMRASGYDLGGVGALLDWVAFHVIFFASLGVLIAVLVAVRRQDAESWKPFLATALPVLAVWVVALGWYRWPCWTGRGCTRLIQAEVGRGNDWSARRIAEESCRGPGASCGEVFSVARQTNDPEWAEQVLEPRCKDDARICRSLGQLSADLGNITRAIRWWDISCGRECGVDWGKLSRSHRWTEIERYLMNACRRARRSACEDDVLTHLADFALSDRDWGESNFAQRCNAGRARACVARASLDWNTRRGDPVPWWDRACKMGDRMGCDRRVLRATLHWDVPEFLDL